MQVEEADPTTADPALAPGLAESVEAIADDARAGIDASIDSIRALRELVAADLGLARAAAARAAAWAVVGLVAASSFWLLLMATLVAGLHRAGLGWLPALASASGLSLVVLVVAVLAARRHAGHTTLAASRKEWRAMGSMWRPAAPQPARTTEEMP